MTEERLFHEALARTDPGERAAYLDRACAGDPALRSSVEALLRAHVGATGFLDPPAPGPADAVREPPDGVRPGTVIGPYKLLELIGEGGMGLVFVAEQARPVHRRVALKVVKPGMDSRQVLARFEAERQALALMDHPNIARVFDGGATTSGRPFFVMELVTGTPVTTFCDEHHLSVRERLGLFLDVCSAVQHAHQKGVIHRDIKPSNVLVASAGGPPAVKVIDFGVAKAIGQQLTELTVHTQPAQLVGTPLYMSPEQAGQGGLDVDTRTDIYALGVLLYELLTGLTPFDGERLRTAGLDEFRRIIREEEPAKPSTRLSTLGQAAQTVSANRRSEPTELRRLVRGELDWIVMKALEKDRDRRYDTAAALAADVRRHLADEPVLAGPPSRGYRLRKFVRRNRGPVLAGGVVALALFGGLTGTTWGMVRAEEHRQVAETNEQKAIGAAAAEREAKEAARAREAEILAVLDFVENRVCAAARPRRQAGGLGRDVTLRQALESALARIDESFPDQPLIEARLRMTLGISFAHLGDAKTAEAQSLRARELYTAALGPDHPLTLSSINNLALSYAALGRHPEALKLHEETLTLRTANLGHDHADTLASRNNLANSYYALNRHGEALRLREETLRLVEARRGPHHRETLRGMNNLANSYHALGRLPEALELYERTLRLQTDHLGPDHPDLLTTGMNLANCLRDVGRPEEALALDDKMLRLKVAKLGPDHPDTLASMVNLGTSYAVLGRHAEALTLREEALRLLKGKHGPDHPHTLGGMWNLAANLVDLNRDAEAVPVIDECLKRAAGKPVDPRLIPGVVDLRLRIFQKANDADGCRATAEMWEKLKRTDADSLLLAAQFRAVTAGALAHNPAAAEEETGRAMGWLHKAVAGGYRDVKQLKSNPDLAALRGRDDFKKLLARVEDGRK
jgi:serine/threonine protein kinase/tetratricopeptide (TPR) repeat protein